MQSRSAKIVLERNYLFRGLSSSIIDKLATLSVQRRFAKGELVFAQGDTGDALYAVVAGRIRISATAASGREIFLNIMEPGDTFGEIAVVDGLPRTAAATAIDPAMLLAICRPQFLQLLEREPTLAVHLLKLFCDRIRWTSELFEESACMTAPARLAKRLLVLANLHGRRNTDGLELQISQTDLAHFLGISRQIVNQYLQDWRRRGWVDLSRARLTLCDPDALHGAVAATEFPAPLEPTLQ